MKTNRFFYMLGIAMVCLALVLVTLGVNTNGSTTKVYSKNSSTEYFNKDEVMKIDIQIDQNEWDDLVENAGDEEFKTVSVSVNGDSFSYVKFRPKGGSSLRDIISSNKNEQDSNPSEANTRFSFKLNFNDILETQTLSGITQLNLNNCFSDPSYMREFISYEIYEKMGLPVPQFCYAEVSINGEYHGLYLAVESILEPYLERNFGNITGDLYKSEGNMLKYTGDISTDTNGLEVKTNRKNADLDLLHNMLKVLNQGENIESVIDVDGALRYIAVTTALVNFDSYLGNFGHNYYIYENDGIFSILPWDLNMSFGGFPMGSVDSVFIDEPAISEVSDKPLVEKLLKDQTNIEKYHKYLEEIVDNYLTPEYLNTKMKEITELISEYVKTDPTALYTYEEFVENTTSEVLMEETIVDKKVLEEKNDNEVVNKEAGKNKKIVPTIIGVSNEISSSINKQLDGDAPTTNEGKGSESQSGPGGNRNGRQGPPPGMEGQGPPEGMRGPPPGMEGQEPPEGMKQGRMRPGENGIKTGEQSNKTQYIFYGILILVFLGVLFWIIKIKKRKM